MKLFSSDNLVQIAWGFSVLRISHEPLFKALALKSIAIIEDFIPSALSMISWSFSNLSIGPSIYGTLYRSIAQKSCKIFKSFPCQVY